MLSLWWNSTSWGCAVMQGHKKSRVNGKKIVHCRQYRVVGLTQKRWDRYLQCSERRIQISLQKMCKKNFQLLHDVPWTWKCCQSLDRRGQFGVYERWRLHGNSPSGSTPNSKKIKDIPQQIQEPREPKGRSRIFLFQLEADRNEGENLGGALANLMCSVVATTKDETASRSVVKVSGSFSR